MRDLNLVSNKEIKLKEIIYNLENKLYVLPRFQRDFKWKISAIEDLGDSILRGYPISSFLIMPVEGNLDIPYRYLVHENDINNKGQEINYILDGQQRITSLNIIFRNKDPNYLFYVDLLNFARVLLPEKEEEIIDSFLTYTEENNIKYHKQVQDIEFSKLCIKYKRPKDKSEISSFGPKNRFILMSNLVGENPSFAQKLNEFIEIFKKEDFFYELWNLLNNKLGLNNFEIPVTKIGAKSDIELIIRVFEKVNSTGLKLSLFDLINAKTFEKNSQNGLAERIKKDIQNQQEGIYLEKFFKIKDNNLERIDSLLRIFFLEELIRKKKRLRLSKKEMLLKEGSFWIKQWESNKLFLFKILKKFDSFGLLDFSKYPFLEYMIAIILNKPELIELEPFLKNLKKFSIALTLSGKSFNMSDLDIVKEFINYGDSLIGANRYQLDTIEAPIPEINSITIKKLENIKVNTPEFRAIMNILYSEKPHNYFTRDISGKIIEKYDPKNPEFDNHHIIPKTICKNSDLKNSIGNIVYLNQYTNRKEIKDQKFNEYIKMLFLINGEEETKKYLENNLIDTKYINKELLTKKEQNEFIYGRLEKILKIINEYLK